MVFCLFFFLICISSIQIFFFYTNAKDKNSAIQLTACWNRLAFHYYWRHMAADITTAFAAPVIMWRFYIFLLLCIIFFSRSLLHSICWLMMISKWHSLNTLSFCTHHKTSDSIIQSQIESDIIYWYQSDDVVIRITDKIVCANVNINTIDAIGIAHTPFDDILMLWPFRSSRIKSEITENREIINKHECIFIGMTTTMWFKLWISYWFCILFYMSLLKWHSI